MTSLPSLAVHRRADIQGLRAVAVLLVVAFHAGVPLPGGFAGVDIFFVISGFVITGMLMRERASTGRIRLGTFYARRFRRLTPALALVVLVTVIASFLLLSPTGTQQVAGLTGIGAMTLIANGVIARTSGGYFDPPAAANPLLNTWSLSVEEQFYLVFPALLLLGWWLGRRLGRERRTVVVLVGAVTIGSFVLAMVTSALRAAEIPTTMLGFYSPVSRVWEFGAGALLALLATRAARIGARTALASGVVGAALIVASGFVLHESYVYPDPSALIPVVGTLLLLLAGIGHSTAVTRGLGWRPLVRVGDWSYSIYLWHWPVIVFATVLWPQPGPGVLAAAVLVSLLPALAAYRWVEQPLRLATWGPRRGDFVGQALLLVLVPVLASATLWLTAERASTFAGTLGGSPSAADLAAKGRVLTEAIERDCLLIGRDFAPGDIERCTFPAPAGAAADGWVLLTGDSHAGAISDGVVDAAHALGYDVVSLSGAGCRFSRTSSPTPSVANCAEMADALLDRIAQDPPAAVVVTQAAEVLVVESSMTELERLGVPVVYFRNNPAFGTGDEVPLPQPCSVTFVGFDCEVSLDEALEFASGTRTDEDALFARHPSIITIDPWATLCSETACSAIHDGDLVYQDWNHLNALGGRVFTDQFADALRRATGAA